MSMRNSDALCQAATLWISAFRLQPQVKHTTNLTNLWIATMDRKNTMAIKFSRCTSKLHYHFNYYSSNARTTMLYVLPSSLNVLIANFRMFTE
uniref:Secreted protein n=1 Tax=Ascaris lumbricoides TaxID=6252 RepID=A0A0M3HYT4_ASCLU